MKILFIIALILLSCEGDRVYAEKNAENWARSIGVESAKVHCYDWDLCSVRWTDKAGIDHLVSLSGCQKGCYQDE